MRGTKAKKARKAYQQLLRREHIPAGYKKYPWGQWICPQRMLYQFVKKLT